jgi:hypothetical protein
VQGILEDVSDDISDALDKQMKGTLNDIDGVEEAGNSA